MIQRDETLARLWSALREVEDPEIPVSLVDMGLIVSLDYVADAQTAKLKITYTAMGCPAMDMIQDDIRARLLREPDLAPLRDLPRFRALEQRGGDGR